MMKRKKKSAGAAAGKKRIRKVVRKAPLRKGVKGKRKTGRRLVARNRSASIPVAPTAAAYNQAFDAGFDEAYNDGFNVGYAEGMEAGHQEAYKGA
ncbi:hypothetical protein [Paenibacillus daejeonensis]|uniref:hypothetical protein n=1 Tax=Paenibacillus daejeonensis TaxID=135193 RepID=UPI000362C215|nr:hypothetical protein [Paenibacillus daejeonensis]